MVRIFVSIALGLFLCAFVTEHKFYMSLTDVQLNEVNQSLELTTRFFTDDVERAISSDERLLRINENMDSDLLPLLSDFYTRGLSMSSGDLSIDIVFIGYEVENELIWCYGEASVPELSNELEVSSKWFYDLFQSQVNIVNVHIGKVRSAYLNNDERTHRFELE